MEIIYSELPEIMKVKLADEDEEVRCPHFNAERYDKKTGKKGRVCGWLLFRGRASTEAQEFKCKSCGKKVLVQRLV